MKKIFTFSLASLFALSLFAQNLNSIDFDKIVSESLAPTTNAELALEKVVDSSIFLRINLANVLNLEMQNIFLYDTLAREIRAFNFSYDVNADTLLFNDQTNTTYSFPKIIRSTGRFVQNQYINTLRETETYKENDVLVNRLREAWDPNTNTFVNNRNITNYFIGNSELVDSIITQFWDPGTQVWNPSIWDFQYFGNDDLRDSVYTYSWNDASNSWRLANKLISQYDALGQQTNLTLFEWDTNTNSFNVLFDVYEYYNGDEFKDSAHVYTFFGGYYGESLSIFEYENNLPASDTIYNWDAALGQLKLTNTQNYEYDADGDLIELRTYAYDSFSNTFTQITQVNYFYSTIETPSTGISDISLPDLKCTFSNPHTLGSEISCDLPDNSGGILAKVYGLDGKKYIQQAITASSFSLKGNLPTGLYILSLENEDGQMGHFKLIIP